MGGDELAPGAGDREPAIPAEVAWRDLRTRRVLPPLVLRAVNQPDHPLDELAVVAEREQFVPTSVSFDVVVEQSIEDVVRRQPVFVELPRCELRRWWLVDDRFGDRLDLAATTCLGVAPSRELPYQRLGHVLDRREPAGAIAVQGREARRELAFVAG